MRPVFQGSFVAIITPFRNGKIDEKAYSDLIEFHVANGTDGIVPCGTTGESATLSNDEHNRLVRITVEAAAGRVPVIAGTGSNSTDEAIYFTKYAKECGADAALLITPYYNKPTQEGLYRHFRAIAEEVDIPIILYNVPGRTGVNMFPSTVARLAEEIENIVSIKEASGSMTQICEIYRLCGERLSILSGEDAINFPVLASGGKGMISVTANIVPKEMGDMWDAFKSGDMARARQIHYSIFDLHQIMFVETNPIPVKTALAMMNKCSEEMRLPLCPIADGNRDRLRESLNRYGLI
ncbi:MAG: 4-hydroxy-tetrahydrodipicolinate synthase [Nitrospirae bacterium]|nr:4-hydroxy-tetrahydrodipicolinate synthase [Nitrospirota bacterium]